jgi:phospholipid-binding lipoprotein MlaA
MRIAALTAVAAMGLCACAPEGMIIHRMPAETPAADNAAAIQKAARLAAATEAAARARAWEPLNRFSYRFNARFDETIFLPLSNGYRRVPSPVRSGVHNFFANLAEVDTVINYTLQGRLGRGVRALGRFVINSTVGIGGLFDFATRLRLENEPTGFGTTLSKWGMHPGPYLVIPIFGPSTLREAVGLVGDYGTSYGVNLANLYRGDVSWALWPLNAVDQRSNIGFRYYSTGSPFEYETIRFLYVRKLLLEDEGLHKKSPRKPRAPDLPAGQ